MPSDPNRVKELFLEAAQLPDKAIRAAFLGRACGDDAGLRARVEALLRAHEPDGNLLGAPAAEVPNPDSAATQVFAGDDGGDAVAFLDPSGRSDSLGRIGHYEVLQVLGRGAFGVVFRAFDDVLRRVVAVKVLAPQLAATSPARKRFLREDRTSASLRHENVVQVHEVGEAALPYLVMEFIPGETLQQRLDRTGPVDAAEVVRVGRQVAEGLATAHATDLIHRDIKPGNILLEGGSRRVKITDFGLARAADDASISQSGIIAGTPMYMAPEQAKGEKLDHRADLFSLGSVLYQMASGRPPFRANGTVAVLKRVVEDTPRDIREITPETPRWLCAIISKLHAKDPADRFQSAREVADVLADCEAQLKAHAKVQDFSRIPRGRPAGGKPGRRAWAAAAVVLLAALALAASEAAGITHLLRPRRPDAAGPPPATPGVPPGGEPRAEPPTGPKGAFVPDPLRAAADGRRTDRRAVEYVLSVGGAVQVNGDGRDLRAAADLPPGEFRLTGVVLMHSERLTDAGLAVFRGCPDVEAVDLSFTALGDAGLGHFADCRALSRADLRFTRLSDAGLAALAGRTTLTYLNLTACERVTDAGLAHLRGCTNLSAIALDATRVTDAGLAALKDCTNLTELVLPELPITDQGLAHLVGLRKLTFLNLRGTRVTAGGVEKLARALPKCMIEWPGGTIGPK